MEQRSFQSLEDNHGTGLLIAFQLCSYIAYCLLSVNVCGAAACDNALFHSCLCSVQSIFHTKLCFLHLGLGSSTYADNCNAAGQLGQSLLQFLFIEIGSGLSHSSLDLSDSVLDCLLVAKAVNDNGILLLNLNGLRTAELLHGSILQLQAKLAGDNLSAGQDCDILQHLFSSVAIARCLDSNYVEGTAQLVDDKGGKSLTLNILCDDEQLRAGLYNLLQQRKNFLNVGDLLIGNQDVGIIQNGFHLLHIGSHVSRYITSVELHTFYQVQLGLHGLGLFNGDNAVLGNLLHSVCNHLADFIIRCGNRCYSCDISLALNRLGHLLDSLNSCIGSLLHALSEHDRVCTCFQVLHTFIDHCLCKNGSSCGTITGNIVGLGSNFSYQLCAHVLELILQLDFLGNGNAIVGDERCAVCLGQHYVSSLRSQSYSDRICKLVNTGSKSFSCLYAKFNFLSHGCIPPYNLNYSMTARMSFCFTITYFSSSSSTSVPEYLE